MDYFFFFSSRRRHTRFDCDWSSDVCSSDLRARIVPQPIPRFPHHARGCTSQAPEIRKPLEKPRIVLPHPAHLRLLQHELRHEHAVRIARAAPRQVAPGAGGPGGGLARKWLTVLEVRHSGVAPTG